MMMGKHRMPIREPPPPNHLDDLHRAWQRAPQRVRAAFMADVGLVGQLKGPVGPQRQEDIHERLEDDDGTQDSTGAPVRPD